MSRTYQDAIAALNSLQSNFAIVDAIRKSGKSLNLQSIPEMIEWCQKLGYQPSDFNRLNIIHIAGTKGKGSTCAFISSILSQYLPSGSQASDTQRTLRKIGLYTSPHLRFVRERIQINNTPLSEEQFVKYFFETWDRLEEAAKARGMDPKGPGAKPVYFRFLTLMALHTYMSEGVDAAIIECGIGGEYDSTNILDKPIVTGITSLGIDHVALLGGTIEEIAWHKAGIMKPGAIACTAPQQEGAMKVLRDRATEKGVELQVATGHPQLRPDSSSAVPLGLAGDVQYKNAELAVSISAHFLRKLGFPDIPADINSAPLPEKFKRGVETVRLGGRCEKRIEGNIAWHIDGGHTLDSIEATGKWYASQNYASEHQPRRSTAPKPRVLVFNQQTRDSTGLARALHATLASSSSTAGCTFTHAVFCTNVTFKEAGYRPDLVSINTNASDVEKLSVQNNLAKVWREVSPETEQVVVAASIEEAVEFVRGLAKAEREKKEREQNNAAAADTAARGESDGVDGVDVSVLVTGSLHLAGGLLEVLETIVADQ
ncbi:hypothetical protein VTO42DRAFT_4915 [Malbranchea cinnamomea]